MDRRRDVLRDATRAHDDLRDVLARRTRTGEVDTGVHLRGRQQTTTANGAHAACAGHVIWCTSSVFTPRTTSVVVGTSMGASYSSRRRGLSALRLLSVGSWGPRHPSFRVPLITRHGPVSSEWQHVPNVDVCGRHAQAHSPAPAAHPASRLGS